MKRQVPSRRLLALGDSYTIGESVAAEDRWPDQLVQSLNQDGIEFDPPTILAKTGWTTGDLLGAIDQTPLDEPFAIVSLLIGVNNQYDGLDEQQYVQQLDRLLDLAIRFAAGNPSHVMVLSIPDWAVTPFAANQDRTAIGHEIDRFNQYKRRQSDSKGCAFVDVTAISRQASSDLSLLAPDGLHPSAIMYAKWCQLMLPVVRQMLRHSSETFTDS